MGPRMLVVEAPLRGQVKHFFKICIKDWSSSIGGKDARQKYAVRPI